MDLFNGKNTGKPHTKNGKIDGFNHSDFPQQANPLNLYTSPISWQIL